MMGLVHVLKEKAKRSSALVKTYVLIIGGSKKWKNKIGKAIRKGILWFTVKRHHSYGTRNKERVFYVIQWQEMRHGLFSMILYLLPYLLYAVEKGYIPVIDLKNSYMPMLQDSDKKGKENAWEYYFEQPFYPYDVNDVYQSSNVVIKVDELDKTRCPDWNAIFPTDEETLKYWSSMFHTYIRLQPTLKKRVESIAQEILNNQKVMGISIRAGYRSGMMRKMELLNGHPRQPSCEEVIAIIEQKLKEWSYNEFFLACDDREYHDEIEKYFGRKCISMKRRLKHYFVDGRPFENEEELKCEYKGSSIRETTEEYIIETYLLAFCDSLYSTGGGGSEFAYFINGGRYKHFELYDDGVYSGIGQ